VAEVNAMLLLLPALIASASTHGAQATTNSIRVKLVLIGRPISQWGRIGPHRIKT